LSDPRKKAYYDTFGTLEGMGAAGGGGGFSPFGAHFEGIFSDIFSEFFGTSRTRRGPRPTKGDDLRYDLEITLEEAYTGVEKYVEVPRHEPCPTCEGKGIKPGGRGPATCSGCNGSGEIHYKQGFFTVTKTCNICNGTGQLIQDPCKECHGSGMVRKYCSVSIKVPPGIDNNIRLRVSGEGESGLYGGPRGDLYVIVSITPHSFFERKNEHLFCRVPMTFPQAALGAEIEIPLIHGTSTTKIKIPPGTRSGKIFTVKGKGMPRLQDYGSGDMLVEVYVGVPKRLTPRQKELLEEFAGISGDTILKEQEQDFVSKVKNFFTNTKEEEY
jgi:molecular chaperone DnaJ